MKLWLAILLGCCFTAAADDFTNLCNDRAAIERVYYNHRTGDKPPFEQTLPRDQIERLVRLDLRKEAALKKVYGVEVTPAMLNAEVNRINTTTRAPNILAELKAALDNDTNRFAQIVARPIIVERELRNRFENDDSLHLARRREAEKVRNAILAIKEPTAEQLIALLKNGGSNDVSEMTWQLGARPEPEPADPKLAEVQKQFGPNAQILSPSKVERERKFYFDDVPEPLKKVLTAQLRKPGDVSAVIETPNEFLLYVAREKTEAVLSVAVLNLPKRSYEEWLQGLEIPKDPGKMTNN